MDPIYLDYNATTPVLPEVMDAMLPYLSQHFGNPSSAHVYGERTRSAVEHARQQVAALLECESDEIYFTSGGTEANNVAIRGVAACSERRQIVTTVIEHPATAEPLALLERLGWEIARVGVDARGQVDRIRLCEAIGTATALVTLMHSNNETGVLQPVAEAARRARKLAAYVHVDAAQSVGRIAVSVRSLDIDLLSVAGHKLYAPKGVGALYVRRGTPIQPLARGGGQERGLRPGTENVAGIVGLGAACSIAKRDLAKESARVRAVRDELWELLSTHIPGLLRNGHPEECLPNTLNVRFPGVAGSAVLRAVPQVAASTGSACHENEERASGVLLAMGIAPTDALCSVRLTLGRNTCVEEVRAAASHLVRAWRSLI